MLGGFRFFGLSLQRIQDVFRHLAIDQARADAIAAAVVDAYGQGRKVLVLTERTEHLDAIQTALGDKKVPSLFVLHGRVAKKLRATLIAELNALPPATPARSTGDRQAGW